MGALRKAPVVKAEVVSDPTVMSGDPVVKGTRILAETILGYLRADCSPRTIFVDYPSLPVDGIDAVARWAEKTYGADWKSAAPERLFVEGPLCDRRVSERRWWRLRTLSYDDGS